MHLSRLFLHHLDGRAWRALADMGETHRLVMGAFPEGSADRVLFRVEPELVGPRSVVLVQSREAPDWSFLGSSSPTAWASSKRVELQLRQGEMLRFRLRANPTVKRGGRRCGYLGEEDVRAWFRRKGEIHGFSAAAERLVVRPEGSLRVGRRNQTAATFRSYLLEGAITVADPSTLACAVESGIGSGKAFGFGLVSLAPLRRD